MITLREFLEKVNAHEHYRIYQPNRDCLIFESYFKIHSPYSFDINGGIGISINNRYFDDNDFCDDVRHIKPFDEETKRFLNRFGGYEVFSIECSSFRPHKVYRREDGKLEIDYLEEDPLKPSCDYINCFNIFIK